MAKIFISPYHVRVAFMRQTCIRGSKWVTLNNNFKKLIDDEKGVRLESSNDVIIYCQNIETSTYADSRDANDEQLVEIVSANLFQELNEKFEDVLVTDLCKGFLRL